MFALSLVGAPLLYRAIGMEGLFALTGVLCLAAMAVVKFQVPDPPRAGARRARRGSLRAALLDAELVRLNAGIFILHIVLYAMFVVVPPLLVQAGLALPEHWKLYLPVVLASFVLMVPAILYADRRNRPKPVLVGAVAAAARVPRRHSPCSAAASRCWPRCMLGFFVAFNVLEALLPSLVSRIAPGAGPRRRDRGLQHHADAGRLLRRAARRLGRFAPRDYRGIRGLRGTGRQSGSCSPPACDARAGAVNELSSLTFSIASGVNLEGLREALARVQACARPRSWPRSASRASKWCRAVG